MRKRLLAGALAGLVLVTTAAACGDDDDASQATPAPAATTPPTTAQAPIQTTAPAPPSVPATTVPTSTAPATTGSPTSTASGKQVVASKIVSLSPTATEMLYAIGAGDQVLAVDDFSNYPEEAASKMKGLNGVEPNVEAIAGMEPDLVVTDGTNADFLGQLDTLGIAHWEGPAAVTFDDTYSQIQQLGDVTGHMSDAADLVSQMKSDIAKVIADLPDLPAPLTYYHELDPNGYWSVTSDTFIGQVYTAAGLQNIADAAGADNPYPQLSQEFIVSQDPDLIFLACTKYCGETPETVAARPGWGAMKAVKNGNVIPMDDDIASRWGPRIVDYIQAVGDAVAHAAGVPAG
jgi:iron complex transport system substrate-binding protein